MNWEETSFKEKLENNHEFPGSYTFKFIVPAEQQRMVEDLLAGAQVKLKPSSGNKYISVTLVAVMQNSTAVIDVYKKAKKIEGIISL